MLAGSQRPSMLLEVYMAFASPLACGHLIIRHWLVAGCEFEGLGFDFSDGGALQLASGTELIKEPPGEQDATWKRASTWKLETRGRARSNALARKVGSMMVVILGGS